MRRLVAIGLICVCGCGGIFKRTPEYLPMYHVEIKTDPETGRRILTVKPPEYEKDPETGELIPKKDTSFVLLGNKRDSFASKKGLEQSIFDPETGKKIIEFKYYYDRDIQEMVGAVTGAIKDGVVSLMGNKPGI